MEEKLEIMDNQAKLKLNTITGLLSNPLYQ